MVACSTVDRDPVEQCRENSDCGAGLICSVEVGNACVPEQPPPQAVIGFDIQVGDLRVELAGCDPEISRNPGSSELRVQKRSEVVRDYDVRATSRRSVLNCGTNECAGVCDEETLTCSEPVDATFALSMASRLGLPDLRSPQKNYVAMPDPPPAEGELPPPVEFTWPTYESSDPKAHSALILDVTPSMQDDRLSAFRRVIAEDESLEALESLPIDAIGVRRCQRGLYGNEGGVRTLPGSPVIGAGVEFAYADEIATPSTVIGTPPSCDDDDDCPAGWACNAQDSCGLDLSGMIAGSTISTEGDFPGSYPPAWVHTYCEDTVGPLDLDFKVEVTPPVDTGLPTVNYSLAQTFTEPPAPDLREIAVVGQFCLPDWQPPQPVSFSVVGEPVALTETELGVYACCSTGCLPSTEPDVTPIPPPTETTCSAFTRVSFETRWYNTDLAEWLFAGCIPTSPASDGSSGSYIRDVSECDEQAGCSVPLTPGGVDELTRSYEVSIVQPPGSVFQSRRFTVQMDAETSEFAEPFELQPRVLLRGEITCGSATNCSATNAVIAAERLRVETDLPNLPGPFFFETPLDVSGKFVLPVDPGVYVITAYPEIGQPGGPSPFAVVDLREGSSLIELVDGVPNATLSEPLELEEGILVRVALEDFEVSTRVTPLDIGSWKAQNDFPADLYDLNSPQTCYGSQGCQIRRVRPTRAPISLLISKEFQFTARSRGSDECE